jgi:hypothetical protein
MLDGIPSDQTMANCQISHDESRQKQDNFRTELIEQSNANRVFASKKGRVVSLQLIVSCNLPCEQTSQSSCFVTGQNLDIAKTAKRERVCTRLATL